MRAYPAMNLFYFLCASAEGCLGQLGWTPWTKQDDIYFILYTYRVFAIFFNATLLDKINTYLKDKCTKFKSRCSIDCNKLIIVIRYKISERAEIRVG